MMCFCSISKKAFTAELIQPRMPYGWPISLVLGKITECWVVTLFLNYLLWIIATWPFIRIFSSQRDNIYEFTLDIMSTSNIKLSRDETREPSLLLEAHKRKAWQYNLELSVHHDLSQLIAFFSSYLKISYNKVNYFNIFHII